MPEHQSQVVGAGPGLEVFIRRALKLSSESEAAARAALKWSSRRRRKWRGPRDSDVTVTQQVSPLHAGEMAAAAGTDVIAEGLVDLLKPAIKQLDLHVHSVR